VLKSRQDKNEQAILVRQSLEFSNGLFTGILTRNNVEGNSSNAGPQPQNQALDQTDRIYSSRIRPLVHQATHTNRQRQGANASVHTALVTASPQMGMPLASGNSIAPAKQTPNNQYGGPSGLK